MSLDFWHQRFIQQASWTAYTRKFILEQISPPLPFRVLEIGCGTGAVLSEFNRQGNLLTGLDLNYQSVVFARQKHKTGNYMAGDAYHLPIISNTFHLCYCHYLLLWLSDPYSVIKEMQRVTQPDGWICIFAEPDYQARVDFPLELETLGLLQNQSLVAQGASLTTGRKLAAWLADTGLKQIHWGIIGAHQASQPITSDGQLEWETLSRDLSPHISQDEINRYREIDQASRNQGKRILYIPTFYAYGQKEKK